MSTVAQSAKVGWQAILRRIADLERAIPGISQKKLTQQLHPIYGLYRDGSDSSLAD